MIKRINLKIKIPVIIFYCVLFGSCKSKSSDKPLSKMPLFKNSIVSTNIDFIKKEDPSAYKSLEYLGQEQHEMPDRRNNILMDDSTFVFKASFTDNSKVEIWAHSSFENVEVAKKYAQMLTAPLGKLPELMRKKLLHVVLHNGDETAFGESQGHFFVLYSKNMETRIRNNDLEETVFHETVHAVFDATYLNNEIWLNAQKKDSVFITKYAASKPNLEDLAESAIFAYTMIKQPGRLSKDIEKWVKQNIPNRFDFFKTIFN